MTSTDRIAQSLLGGREAADVLSAPDAQVRIAELYRLYVELMDRTTARRQTAGSFFVTLNAALLTLGGVTNIEGTALVLRGAAFTSAAGGIVASLLWWRLIRAYRELNGARFRVIEEIERLLPIRPFEAEKSVLTSGQARAHVVTFSGLEQVVPLLFVVLHVIAAVLRIVAA